MARVRWFIRNVEEIVGCTLLVIMVLTVTLAVFARVLNVSIVWTDELARYTFIWTVYIGSVVAIKRRGHIALDFLIKLCPPTGQKLFYAVIQIALLILFGIMFKYGFYLTKETWDVPTTSLEIPTGMVYLAVPVSCFLMIIHTLVDMWKTLRIGTLAPVEQMESFEGEGA